jgi:hypothetical protein
VNKLDLRNEAKAIRSFIASSAHRYAKQFPKELVTGLQVYYSLNNGFMEVSYWTNPNYDPFYYDTTKARFLDKLRLPHWEEFYERWFKELSEAIDLNGSIMHTEPGVDAQYGMKTSVGGGDVVEAIGRLLVAMLTSGRNDGLFKELPRSPAHGFGVEDDDDVFHWEETPRV